jgi:hypothetical protein
MLGQASVYFMENSLACLVQRRRVAVTAVPFDREYR